MKTKKKVTLKTCILNTQVICQLNTGLFGFTAVNMLNLYNISDPTS